MQTDIMKALEEAMKECIWCRRYIGETQQEPSEPWTTDTGSTIYLCPGCSDYLTPKVCGTKQRSNLQIPRGNT